MAYSVTHLDMKGCPLPKSGELPYPHLAVEVYRSPHEYSRGSSSVRDWQHVGAHIRSANLPICKGGINPGFFSVAKHTGETSLVFILSGVPNAKARYGHIYAFALCNDLTNKRHHDERENEEKSLYIDAICANPLQIRADRRVGLENSAGKILIDAIEKYGRRHRFKNVRLSALPYVIQYYRKLGFRHVSPGGRAEHEDPTLTRLADLAAIKRYASDGEMENAYRAELALAFRSLGSIHEQRAAEIRNLNAYFPAYYIAPSQTDVDKVTVVPRLYDVADLDLAHAQDREELDELRSLESLINEKLDVKRRALARDEQTDEAFAIRNYLNALVRRGFALDCESGQTARLLMDVAVDEEGDKTADLVCDEGGFTMRKSISKATPLIKCSSKRGGGRNNLTRKYKMGYRYSRRRSTRRRSRRHHKRCPKGTARKIVGQRRRWSRGVDRIVKHGHLSRKCYRKRNTRRRR